MLDSLIPRPRFRVVLIIMNHKRDGKERKEKKKPLIDNECVPSLCLTMTMTMTMYWDQINFGMPWEKDHGLSFLLLLHFEPLMTNSYILNINFSFRLRRAYGRLIISFYWWVMHERGAKQEHFIKTKPWNMFMTLNFWWARSVCRDMGCIIGEPPTVGMGVENGAHREYQVLVGYLSFW